MNYSRLCGGIFLSLLLSMSADVSAFSFFSKKAPVVAPVKKEVAVQTVSPKTLPIPAQKNFFRAHPTMTKWLIGGSSVLAIGGTIWLIKHLNEKQQQPNIPQVPAVSFDTWKIQRKIQKTLVTIENKINSENPDVAKIQVQLNNVSNLLKNDLIPAETQQQLLQDVQTLQDDLNNLKQQQQQQPNIPQVPAVSFDTWKIQRKIQKTLVTIENKINSENPDVAKIQVQLNNVSNLLKNDLIPAETQQQLLQDVQTLQDDLNNLKQQQQQQPQQQQANKFIDKQKEELADIAADIANVFKIKKSVDNKLKEQLNKRLNKITTAIDNHMNPTDLFQKEARKSQDGAAATAILKEVKELQEKLNQTK